MKWLTLCFLSAHFHCLLAISTDGSDICLNQDIQVRAVELFPPRPIYQAIQLEYRANRSLYGLSILYDVIQIFSNRSNWMHLVENGDLKNVSYSSLQTPMTPEDGQKYPELVSFPIMASALAFVYNVPNITDLNLTHDVIAGIFLGKIRNWNDSLLQDINPDIVLPDKKIIYQITKSDTMSDTFVFTSILSAISREWKDTYGIVTDTFPDNTTLPLSKTSYTILGSAQYSIGYVSWSSILTSNTRPANILTSGGYFPLTQTNVRSSVTMAENKANLKLIESVPNPNLLTIGYPFIYFHHIVINFTTPPNVSCCSMQETVGLLNYFLDASLIKKQADFAKSGYMPISDKTINAVRNTILPLVVCNGKFMNSAFKKYTVVTTVNDNWELGMGLGISLGLIVIIMLSGFTWYYKNVKFANETLWLINQSEIVIQYDNKTMEMLMGSAKSINSINSTHTAKSLNKKVVKKFNLSTAFWKKNQNIVFISSMKLGQVSNWRRKTKLLITSFTKEIDHPNLCPLFGVCVIETTPTLVSPICAKGTLHYVLATSPYQMSVEVKYILAKEILSGLRYLHQKNVTHGTLNSISTYIDAKWNVKLTDWAKNSILESEFVQLVQEDCSNIEDNNALIKLLYVDSDCFQMMRPNLSSDMYSYGMMLIEIFTRQIPYSEEVEFGDNSYPAILTKKMQNIQCIPMLNPVDVPSELKQLIISLIGSTANRPTVLSTSEQMRKFHNQSGDSLVDFVMQTLEKYVEDLEEKVMERTSDLTNMTNRMKMLLNEVLPPQIATKFINEEPVEPEFYECASIFFSDIVGFTVISAKSTPIQVMNFLNALWNLFDNTMVNFDVYKVDTIGDAYMVASGLPNRNGIDHCKHIANLALALRENVKSFTLPHLPDESVRIRMGINSGPVTAGIVGHKMPQYCVFGDTVNTASRMESSSLPMKIQTSSFSKTLINQYFPQYNFELRGEIEIKVNLSAAFEYAINQLYLNI